MIRTFKCPETRNIFRRLGSREFAHIENIAYRKLLLLEAALRVQDLRIPPGNRLEALHGDRQGQYSIRINRKYRICFGFEDGAFIDVEIVDYH